LAQTHDDRITWPDITGSRLSPARDEPLGPDDGAINRIDLERRDHRGNAAGQNDLGQDLRLAGAKCPCELDLVDFNTLKPL
jgi:hypothetical protein